MRNGIGWLIAGILAIMFAMLMELEWHWGDEGSTTPVSVCGKQSD